MDENKEDFGIDVSKIIEEKQLATTGAILLIHNKISEKQLLEARGDQKEGENISDTVQRLGFVKKEDYDNLREKVAEKLKDIRDNEGNFMDTKIFKPEDLYTPLNGDPPDLLVYFDDLNWRSAGTVGCDSMYLNENDTGPDDAVHDYHGIFIIFDPKKKIGKDLGTKNILDIAPTSLKILGIEIPEDMEGNIIKF